MPRFNPFTGEAVCGVAGTRPSVDGVAKGAVDSISPTVWFDTDHILHRSAAGELAKTNIRTDTTEVLGGVVNELSAGCCGTYLAWGAGVGLTGAITLPDGGLNRVITDSRGANCSDKTIAYVPIRSNIGSTIVKKSTGMEVELPDVYGMHLLKWNQAVWNATSTALGFWGTTCAYIPGAQYAKLARIGGVLWIVYFLPTVGLIAHKAVAPDVYHLVVAGSSAYHMDVIEYQSKLAVCYSATTGEGAGDLVKVMDVIGTKPTTPVPPDIVAGGATVGPFVPEVVKQVVVTGKQPQFADLKSVLAQTKNTENPLYQVVSEMISRLTQLQKVTLEEVRGTTQNTTSQVQNVASKFATYHTKNNEVTALPNSVQLLAGVGIAFDDVTPNKRTISSTATGGTSNFYEAPLTDGNVDETDLIFANGECIIVQVPNAPSTS